MIKNKFDTKTRSFFLGQQFCYVVLCIAPFIALSVGDRDWDMITALLVTSMFGQTLFMILELVNWYEQGSKEYLQDWTNLSDLT